MNSLSFSSSPPHLRLLLFSLLFIMPLFPLSHSNPEQLKYDNCRNKVFKCGNIYAGYPFSGGDRIPECGHRGLELHCDDHTTTIEILGVKYQVVDIHHDRQILRIAREEFINNDFCRPQIPIQDSIIDYQLFDLAPAPAPAPGYTNATLFYDCQSLTPSGLGLFPCNSSNYKNVSVTTDNISGDGCVANVSFPIFQTSWEKLQNNSSLLLILEEALRTGFEVQWKEDKEACRKCNFSGGACGFGVENQTICYCDPFGFYNSPDLKECHGLDPSPSPGSKSKSKSKSKQNLIFIGLGIAGGGTAGILLGIGILRVRKQWRKKIATQVISSSRDLPKSPSSEGATTSTTNTSQSKSSYSSSKYDIERGSTYFGAHVFSYEELEEATDNFHPSKQLGKGGFGTVYYGVLKDGRVVAIKRLFKHNFKCVDQYMNEIEILTSIRHPNLMTLYGCTSRRSRELLLVYEYVPNGTVADHLHGKRSNSASLTWHVRLSIAVETAKALAYLHASDVIHRDVKSNNILLDKNFHVKVADFGLSRLFPTDVTHVSTAPQGTPGYVDPEYHQFYQLTEKSDVYSFGVVLVELVSAKQAVDFSRHLYDINLANMAISRIQNQALHELVDPSLGFENDCAVKNAVTAVAELAFRCLQHERDTRPSMEEVLETLRETKDVRTEAEVVDIRSDDVGLLKNIPPLSPDYGTDKWFSFSTITSPNSF